MKLILTDEVEHVAPGVMLFTKQRLAEILEFIKDDGEQTRAAEHRNEADGEQTCPSCDGRGGVTGILSGKYYKCAKCDGTGHV